MTEEEFDVIYGGLTAVYPRAFNDDSGELRVIWRSYFIQHDYRVVRAATRTWVGAKSKAPSIADLREAVRAEGATRRPDEVSYAQRVRCNSCDNGWVYSSPHRDAEVSRCPRGCKPPRMGIDASRAAGS